MFSKQPQHHIGTFFTCNRQSSVLRRTTMQSCHSWCKRDKVFLAGGRIHEVQRRPLKIFACWQIQVNVEREGRSIRVLSDGLVLARLRHIPKEGEFIVEAGYRFTVVEASERAIGKLRVEPELSARRGETPD